MTPPSKPSAACLPELLQGAGPQHVPEAPAVGVGDPAAESRNETPGSTAPADASGGSGPVTAGPATSDPVSPGPGAAGTADRLQPRWAKHWNNIPSALVMRTAVSLGAAAAAVCAGVSTRADGTFLDSSFAGSSPQAVLGPAGSLLAPVPLVWWLWLPIVAGWLGYALYQWLPRQRRNPRHQRFGWMVLASQITAFGWLLAVSSDSTAGVLTAAIAQTAVGLVAIHTMNCAPASSWLEGFLTDVPLGLSLAAGVLSLGTAVAFMLTQAEADLAGWGGTAWALIGLMTVAVGVTVVCMTDRGHLPVALAVVWGLSCIAAGRFTGAPESIAVGAAAAAGAFLVLVSAGSRRHQVDHERRWAERHSQGASRGQAQARSDAALEAQTGA